MTPESFRRRFFEAMETWPDVIGVDVEASTLIMRGPSPAREDSADAPSQAVTVFLEPAWIEDALGWLVEEGGGGGFLGAYTVLSTTLQEEVGTIWHPSIRTVSWTVAAGVQYLDAEGLTVPARQQSGEASAYEAAAFRRSFIMREATTEVMGGARGAPARALDNAVVAHDLDAGTLTVRCEVRDGRPWPVDTVLIDLPLTALTRTDVEAWAADGRDVASSASLHEAASIALSLALWEAVASIRKPDTRVLRLADGFREEPR